MIQSKSEFKHLIDAQYKTLKKVFFVKKLGVFGSFSRSEQTEKSDLDVLVEFEKPVGIFTFVRLQNRLSDLSGRKVDLATPKSLKKITKNEILQEVEWI